MSHSSGNVAKRAIAKAAPAPAADRTIFRLTDMEVEEVSLVDRAANMKRFIVVKQETPMPKEIVPNGKGGFTAAQQTAAKGKTEKAALEVPPGFKEAAGPLLDKAVAAIETLQASLKGSTPAEITEDGDLPGVPAEFSSGCQKVVDLLGKLTTMWPTAPAADPDSDGDAAGDNDADGDGAPTEMQMRLAEKAVGDAANMLKRAGVAKIGAKMSKDRYTRLQQAAQVLTNLIGELAPPAGAEAAPALGKAKAPPMPPAKGKDDEEEKAKAKKYDEALVGIGQAISKIGTAIGGLTAQVAQQAQAIATIQKSRGLPTSLLHVEENGAPAPVEENVSWPLDMNNHVTRKSVSKTESFFDIDD